MRIYYLQHVPFENPGIILSWAEYKNYPVMCTRLYADEMLPSMEEFDWLVIMGGPMNIYQETEYPWLKREKEFIKAAIAGNKVVIGLCLGGQLIADAIGGRVIRNRYVEIGWFPVTFTKQGLSLPVLSHLPDRAVIFEWHGDTFVDLPEEAVLLAENEACENQAFSYGSRVFGFQFHMENTMHIIRDLIENCREEMVPGPYIQTADEILAGTGFVEHNNEWMLLFLSKLAALYEEGEI
ncbi:type 1 glutamine amidotransferase [Lachnospiraceae bacterium 54-53]